MYRSKGCSLNVQVDSDMMNKDMCTVKNDNSWIRHASTDSEIDAMNEKNSIENQTLVHTIIPSRPRDPQQAIKLHRINMKYEQEFSREMMGRVSSQPRVTFGGTSTRLISPRAISNVTSHAY
mmetsp:Transcript_9679/g.17444  ORF Transcript_9679/g.17444 Transcript_9679/m.17444 type:complete len:122 (+) Transcript_9679:1759-2124(+)